MNKYVSSLISVDVAGSEKSEEADNFCGFPFGRSSLSIISSILCGFPRVLSFIPVLALVVVFEGLVLIEELNGDVAEVADVVEMEEGD